MQQLPELSYAYDSLEPHIDAETMEIHHSKHHQGYINKYNAALENFPELQEKHPAELLMNIDDVPEEIQQAVINHGGGHANHSLFWEIMSLEGGGEPTGALADAINSVFGDFATFKEQFTAKAGSLFGSGWAWLCVANDGALVLKRTSFQNSPLMSGLFPILGIDVWEHAYYLKHQNRRPEYIEAWWKVVDWNKVNEMYEKANQMVG